MKDKNELKIVALLEELGRCQERMADFRAEITILTAKVREYESMIQNANEAYDQTSNYVPARVVDARWEGREGVQEEE